MVIYYKIHLFVPPTLLVRALRLRPTEVPVRPCRVPRDAKVLRAAPAVDPVVEPAVKKDKPVNVMKLCSRVESPTGH